MIQVYKPSNTDFSKNGDVVLLPEVATVTAELNGTWSAYIEHPIDEGGKWKALVDNAVVKMPSYNGDQLFRIKTKEKNLEYIICEMQPIFFDAANDCFLEDVRPTLKTGQQALSIMTAANTKYSGVSDISKVSTAYYEYKNLLEAISGEEDNSFLNRWGGEIEYNNYTVRIMSRLGADNGVEYRYGKNLQSVDEFVDMQEVVTRIYPKAFNGRMRSGTKYIDSPLINSYPTIRSAVVEFDDIVLKADLLEGVEIDPGVTVCNTQAELDAALGSACQYQFDAGIDKPSVTVTIEGIVNQIEGLQGAELSLGDTVHLRHPLLDIVTDARVVSLTYDSINKEVIGVTIGNVAYNYFDTISSAVTRIQTAVKPDGTVKAENVGGIMNLSKTSLYAQYDVAEEQDVLGILFENNDSTSELYGAMAIGTQGFMISKSKDSDGNWIWSTWGTANGLVANYISTGTLSASVIAAHSVDVNKLSGDITNGDWKLDLDAGTLTIGDISANNINGGTLTLGGNNNVSGVLQVLNSSGNVIGTWDKDGIDIDAGKIEIGNNFSVDSSGNLTASNATLGSSGTGYSAKVESGQISLYYGSDFVGRLMARNGGSQGNLVRFESGPDQHAYVQLSDANKSIGLTASDGANTSSVTMTPTDININSGSTVRFQNAPDFVDGIKVKGITWSNYPVIDLTTPSFNSLPKTYYSSYITANHVVAKGCGIELSNPAAQTGDWTITTADGSITISGSISGTTTANITLVAPTVTATATTTA